MLNATVHVLLVSAQAAPNLLPTLDPQLKPREAILLVSAKMKPRADALESVLREAGIRTARVELDDEHDFNRLQELLRELAAQRAADRIALNVTGGTKLMALAAHSVAAQAEWPVFYVDVDTDEVIVLGSESCRQRLSNTLRLSHYLRAYGYQAQPESEQPKLGSRCLDLMKNLLVNIGSLQQHLSQLNGLAQQAEDGRTLHAELSANQLDSRGLETLLRDFAEAGVLTVKGAQVAFVSEAHRSFAKGGWLEQHVFRTVGAVTDELGIRDKDTNLCVVDHTGVKNELDVAFMARNRLFVIECKTARMDGDRTRKANDALYKLAEICRRVGGLGTRAMLASYRGLDEPERRLARALSIELACGRELANLPQRLREWVKA